MTSHGTANDGVDILVAEDSTTQALRLQFLLEEHGYRVTVCENGQLALDAARRRKPTLVISDVVMPEMDGYSLCRAFKADPRLQDVPFLLVTTLDDTGDVLRGLEAGADSFVLKPYDDRFLLNRVAFALQHRPQRSTPGATGDRGGPVEIVFDGRVHAIDSDRSQILGLLLSTYDAAIRRNVEVRRSEDELRQANDALSAEVRRRRVVEQELAEATRRAETANEAKSAFLAMMSHEIRTPMNGILGMAEVLAHGELSRSQADAVRTLRESAFALLHLIDEILDFSKVEAGRIELERLPVDLPSLLGSVCQTLSAMADSRGVDLACAVASDVPTVLVDPVRVRQVLYNLVGNAVKFSGDQHRKRGRVDVRVEVVSRDPLQVALAVKDNGVGIAPEALAGVFEPFHQAESSTTRRFGGSGLGLAICQRLVQLMGGRITVDSVPGEGSTFTVTLPLDRTDETALAGVPAADLPSILPIAAPTVAEARACGRLVLVAEDDSTSQKVLQRQLQLLGHAAEFASDGEEALALWRRGGYVLLLTDLQMPMLDGFGLARAIRGAEPPGQRMPIVAISANALPGEAARAQDAGIDDYLTKPLQLAALRAALDRWLPTPTRHAAGAARSTEPAVLLDPSVLARFIGEDPGTRQAVLEDFLRNLEAARVSFDTLGAAADMRPLGRTAHRLRSACLTVGALPLGDILAALENGARLGDRHAVTGAVAAFASMADALVPELRRQLATSVTVSTDNHPATPGSTR